MSQRMAICRWKLPIGSVDVLHLAAWPHRRRWFEFDADLARKIHPSGQAVLRALRSFVERRAGRRTERKPLAEEPLN